MSEVLRERTVLLTRAADDNAAWAERLRARGARAVALPCLETAVAREAAGELAERLAECDWLALSSRRGVRAVAELLPGGLPRGVRVACVGPATAVEARSRLGRADEIAPAGTGRSLGVRLAATLPPSARVVVAAAEEGRVDVEDALAPAGIEVRRVAVYRTVSAPPRSPRLELAALGVEAVLLASPSAARGLANQAELPPGAAVVTIGPTTSRAAREAGYHVDAEAAERSLEGMLAALERALARRQEERR